MALNTPYNIWSDMEIEYDINTQIADNYQVTSKAHRPSTSKIYSLKYERQIVWHNVVLFIILHIIAAYGFYLEISGHIQKKTILFST